MSKVGDNKPNYVGSLALAKAAQGLAEVSGRQRDREDYAEYLAKAEKIKGTSIESICDAQGYFEFEDIETGEYHVGTTVEWYVAGEKQGGFIHKKIQVKKGKNKVFLTK